MSRRVLYVDSPGIQGEVSDLLPHQLPAKALERGIDVMRREGVCQQRRGWVYDPDGTDLSGQSQNTITIWRAPFVLADSVRMLTGDESGDVFYNQSSGTAITLLEDGIPRLARCQYRDEVILCAQDGVTPARRWAGASGAITGADLVGTTVDLESRITSLTINPAAGLGTFVTAENFLNHLKIVQSTTSAISLEDVLADAALALTIILSRTGVGFPAVEIYDEGSFTASTGVLTGFGTRWDDAGIVAGDAISFIQDGASVYEIHAISDVDDDDTLDAPVGTVSTKIPYKISRSLPFKDAAAHKESFWGTGVKEHPDRVYCAPTGWNLSAPPGFTVPFSPIPGTAFETDDQSFYYLDFIEVPSPYDGDDCVAILSSPNPLITLKRKDAYGITGGVGNLDVNLLPNGEGAGCIDIRSAWELPLGPMWAGENGVFVYMGGRVVDLTKDRINSEWRRLIEDFDFGTNDYCTIGEAHGVYRVHLTTGGGVTQRTWDVYPYAPDGRWNPAWYRVSNFNPRAMFTSKVPGEVERLLAADDDEQGRLLDAAPSMNGSGDARDDDGTSPAMELWLPRNLPRLAGANVEERMLEVSVEANLNDSAGAGSTLGGTVVSSERLDSDTAITTNLNSMASKTTDAPRRYRHRVGVRAGLHQIKLVKSATQTTEGLTEVSRIGMTFRAGRRPL